MAYAHTVAFSGIDVKPIDVQVQISAGLPAFTIVGLPDKAVGESRERVRSALGALGIGLPTRRITVNLAPADLLKEGSHFDLPIALAMLVAIGAIPADAAQGLSGAGRAGARWRDPRGERRPAGSARGRGPWPRPDLPGARAAARPPGSAATSRSWRRRACSP